jgi:hypothetical protein
VPPPHQHHGHQQGHHYHNHGHHYHHSTSGGAVGSFGAGGGYGRAMHSRGASPTARSETSWMDTTCGDSDSSSSSSECGEDDLIRRAAPIALRAEGIAHIAPGALFAFAGAAATPHASAPRPGLGAAVIYPPGGMSMHHLQGPGVPTRAGPGGGSGTIVGTPCPGVGAAYMMAAAAQLGARGSSSGGASSGAGPGCTSGGGAAAPICGPSLQPNFQPPPPPPPSVVAGLPPHGSASGRLTAIPETAEPTQLPAATASGSEGEAMEA